MARVRRVPLPLAPPPPAPPPSAPKRRGGPGRPLPPFVAQIFADAGIKGLDDLAARVGLAASTIRALRCDPRRVSSETRQRLALVLKITRELLDSTVFPTTRAA